MQLLQWLRAKAQWVARRGGAGCATKPLKHAKVKVLQEKQRKPSGYGFTTRHARHASSRAHLREGGGVTHETDHKAGILSCYKATCKDVRGEVLHCQPLCPLPPKKCCSLLSRARPGSHCSPVNTSEWTCKGGRCASMEASRKQRTGTG